MNLFASLTFLLLTPPTLQNLESVADRAYAACQARTDFVEFVAVVKTCEVLRRHLIRKGLRQVENAKFIRMVSELNRVFEEEYRIRRKQEQAEHAKQNPGV